MPSIDGRRGSAPTRLACREYVAVLAEMYSVVIRVATLTAHYPGGVESYATDCPNSSFCSDGEVCRVGFMSWADTESFLRLLRRFDIALKQAPPRLFEKTRACYSRASGWSSTESMGHRRGGWWVQPSMCLLLRPDGFPDNR